VTAMVEALFEKFPERREEWPKQNMLGRLSRPEEYRGAAAFLISDASSFMTGSDLRMDGMFSLATFDLGREREGLGCNANVV
jgi:NAD(P)-dependent dehydrogenase (short-subunit alcohol dehydrogenase family)